MNYNLEKQTYHILTNSPWPIFVGLFSLEIPLGLLYFNNIGNSTFFFYHGLFSLIGIVISWWQDTIKESIIEGSHSRLVKFGLKFGFFLFILSEIMFFSGFFWAFFHSSFSPVFQLGTVWPPTGLITASPWDIPFLNTIILLSSGIILTYVHHLLLNYWLIGAFIYMKWVLFLAITFLMCQVFEYFESVFNISSSVFGSVFFMATGFHGFHVIIGTIFLTVIYFRLKKLHYTPESHSSFEMAAWYWHFVDVVWIFLFVMVYWWGSL